MPPPYAAYEAWRRLPLCVCLVGLLWAALPPLASAKRNVYVSDGNISNGSLVAYDVGTGGALSEIQRQATGTTDTTGMAFTPDGRFLFNTACCPSSQPSLASFGVGSNGLLTPLTGSPRSSGGDGTNGAAVTPDGRHLYVTNEVSDTVSAFTVGPDGSLTAVTGSPFGAGMSPLGLAITPDGQHLYVANGNEATLSTYAIAADGSLAPGPVVPLTGAANPQPVKITPDGRHVYVGDSGTSRVYAFSVGGGGALTGLPNSPFDTGGASPEDLAITAAGNWLYAIGTGSGGDVTGFNITNDGQLSTISGSPFTAPSVSGPGHLTIGGAVTPDGGHLYVSNVESSAGDGSAAPLTINADGSLTGGTAVPIANADPDLFSVAITPDQPPAASFVATPARAGKGTTFDASGSSDPDGAVASYAWNFGDGSSATATTPVLRHTYARPGTYAATLTTTDNEGCSTSLVYTGQSPLCNGSQVASTTRTVVVPERPNITKPSIRPKRFAVDPKGAPAKVRPKRGTTIRYTLNVDATVTFKAENQSKGRLVNGKCKRPSKKNRKHRACLLFKTAGFFARSGVRGPNKFNWSGKVLKYPPNSPKGRDPPDTLNARKWLRRGTYRLTLKATNSVGLTSAIRRLSFRVVKR